MTKTEGVFWVALIVSVTLLASGCQSAKKQWRHTISSVSGLDRTVRLYSADGKEIKEWTGKFMVELEGGVASWLNADGKEVKISGTYIIEQN